MSAQIIGKVPHFDHKLNGWSVFECQLEQFFIANDIEDEKKKKAILLTSVCETSYILLQNLVSPAKVEATTTTFAMCVTAMKQHFKASTAGFAERYKFYNATKSSTETINEWAVRVRALAVNCEFGTCLETAIRDKFVMGLEMGPARDKIFLEAVTVKLDKVVEIANNTEYMKHQYDTVEVKQEPPFNFIKHHKRGTSRKEATKPET